MKIKLNTARTGEGIFNQIGEVIDVPDDEAARYVKSGQAEYVKDQPTEAERGSARPQKSER